MGNVGEVKTRCVTVLGVICVGCVIECTGCSLSRLYLFFFDCIVTVCSVSYRLTFREPCADHPAGLLSDL